ncbi:carboxypeptidase N subunit 2-like [Prorops nasuta]|uniref:carboxypeptidase N subunit 2-like n=1 Tax=Prorops nasuta TaxID=863751 RepID=UPI0034CD4208
MPPRRKWQSALVPLVLAIIMRKQVAAAWECPKITRTGMECSCDFPHTLRCTGDATAIEAIGEHLRNSRKGTISVLDLTVTGISYLPGGFLEKVSLLGLVFSSGELKRVDGSAFDSLARPLQALGLPNNLLEVVPTAAFGNLLELEQLDLSRNKLRTLQANSFKGLSNLTNLDLSENLLTQMSPQAFASLTALRVLGMRGNRLSISALSALRGLRNLEELDLSSNLLLGPLGPNFLARMPKLHSLSVSDNKIVNVSQGALVGLKSLTYLDLSHNQIDVLEDHSFKNLSTLTSLDLANNHIVAVSSASLAHLDNLISLNLSHNFLWSLTSDLIVPLMSLEILRLDDNDITMISSDLPSERLDLKGLSLADNPLNCDCTLLEFANWLSNSSLSEEDKASAVCATPPALENGILSQVSTGSLLCGEPSSNSRNTAAIAATQLTLKQYQYEKSTGMRLLWQVEPCTEERYTCDTLIVYETIGDNEIQTGSSPLHCDSTLMRDPCSLPVLVPNSFVPRLQLGHQYRYCVVILPSSSTTTGDLGLGCSDVIVHENATDSNVINEVRVNVSDQGLLSVDVTLSVPSSSCTLSILLFNTESVVPILLHTRKLNCSLASVTLPVSLPGRYKVCASLTNDENGNSKCVEVQGFKQKFNLIILAVVGASGAVLLTVGLLTRSTMKKRRHPPANAIAAPPQCFLPAQEFEITHKARYIKLLATTKV